MEDVKKTAQGAPDKVNHLAAQHGDKAKDALDKAADMADDKTGGKYGDKIDQGAEKAKDAIDKMAHDDK